MDDKNYKPVYVQGIKTGKGVIEALEAYGGINNCGYEGNCESNLYYIDPDTNFICGMDVSTRFASYLKATAKELKPLKWRAKRTEDYYTLDSVLDIIKSTEYGDRYDNGRYDSGNYYRTRKEAEIAAEKIKKVLLSN